MEHTQNQQKQENQNLNQNVFPIGLTGSLGIPQKQISYLNNLNSELNMIVYMEKKLEYLVLMIY